jgi:DNA topoisomerase VI subunit B
MPQTLARTTFQTSRLLEFFSEKELQMQIGFAQAQWPLALLNALLNNALDACETAGMLPDIATSWSPMRSASAIMVPVCRSRPSSACWIISSG